MIGKFNARVFRASIRAFVHRQSLACLVLVIVSSAVRPHTSLDSFKREAESALGVPIQIIESSKTGGALGETFCAKDSVLIVIERGLAEDLRDPVIAHELGHALLCARGIRTVAKLTDQGTLHGSEGLLTGFEAIIASCYIDPLADAEAQRRGFDVAKTVDEFAHRIRGHTAQDFSDSIKEFGNLWIRYFAAGIYCAGLRPHTFQMKVLEQFLASEPSIVIQLDEYRRVLGAPKCNDKLTCFRLTKRLRDEAKVGTYIRIENPVTHSFE